jgi:hypothetical protein
MAEFIQTGFYSYLPIVKARIEAAKLAAEEAGILAVYHAVMEKIDTPSSVPSSPGSPPHRFTGDLVEGTVYTVDPVRGALIGFKSPASHAHLLQFGTPHMAPRPFLDVAFEESGAQHKMEDAFRMVMGGL